jgi:hypothetical protein
MIGAGEGNRTLVVSLGSFCSAIELHPLRPERISEPFGDAKRAMQARPVRGGREGGRYSAILIGKAGARMR